MRLMWRVVSALCGSFKVLRKYPLSDGHGRSDEWDHEFSRVPGLENSKPDIKRYTFTCTLFKQLTCNDFTCISLGKVQPLIVPATPKHFKMQMNMAFSLSKNHWRFEVWCIDICSPSIKWSISQSAYTCSKYQQIWSWPVGYSRLPALPGHWK